MKTILLTGGSGFIGKNIRESFLKDRYKILAPSSKELNLSDKERVDNFFENHKIDIVIHSAGKPGHRNACDHTNLFYTNTQMFFNLESKCEEFEKMIIMGSGAIYDMRHYRPKVKEEQFEEYIPTDEHGFCKYICGKHIEKSEKIIDFRIFGIFGKYEDYAIRFISNAICKTLFDLPITIKQNRKFDYIFVDDLMPVLEYFVENKVSYKSYNITPDKSISLLDIANIVKNISGKDLPIKIAQEGMGLEYSGNNARLKNEIKDIKLESIENSITKLYNWYETHKHELCRDVLLTDK